MQPTRIGSTKCVLWISSLIFCTGVLQQPSVGRDETPDRFDGTDGLNADQCQELEGMQRGRAASPLAKWRGITAHILQYHFMPLHARRVAAETKVLGEQPRLCLGRKIAQFSFIFHTEILAVSRVHRYREADPICMWPELAKTWIA